MVSDKDREENGKNLVECHSSDWVIEFPGEKPKRRKLDSKDGLPTENTTTLPVVAIPTGQLEAPPDYLVCRTCTFNNSVSWASKAPDLPLPTFCAMCLQPLQTPSVESRELPHQPSPGKLQGFPSTPALSSNCSTSEYTSKAIKERTCPVCTVILKENRDTTVCHLCGTFLALPDQSAIIDRSLGVECRACTFRNDPSVNICDVCETPLIHGRGGCDKPDNDTSTALLSTDLGQKSTHADICYRSSAGIVIPSASELTGRTIEEAGDSDAATEGLIPRLQQRLIDEHGKRVGEGAWGNQVQGTSPGRVGLSGCLNGASAKKGDAQWRLCDPRTVHCTQLGSEGSEFSCGYRNIQILCSALMEWPEYRRVLFGGSGFIPGILLLQCWIERAWADGYDPEGCEQLGGPGSLMGSEKWIGATECAVLLRSFGVKAELIDFESSSSGDIPLEIPSPKGITEVSRTDAPYTHDFRHGHPGSPRTAARHSRVLQKKQQSIRSYLPSVEVGGGKNSPSKVTSNPSTYCPAPLAVKPRHGEYRSPESRKSNAACVGSGTSSERIGHGDERTWRRRDQLTLGGRRSQCGRRGRSGNVGNESGRRMGRAIIEWTWEYFHTSWDVRQVFPVSSCSFPGRSREGLRDAKLNTTTARSRPRELGMPLLSRKPPWGAVEAPGKGFYDGGGKTGGGDGVARGENKPTTMESSRNSMMEARVTRTRPPPPLYFQHDGHSRSIVGVLRSGAIYQSDGREKRCLADIGACHDTENKGIGRDDRDFEAGDFHPRQLGSLLVFDPYHSGSVIRRALDDKGTKRSWCSLLKRGENSLHRRQFQIVAVRPGLIKAGEANTWKELVSIKIDQRQAKVDG